MNSKGWKKGGLNSKKLNKKVCFGRNSVWTLAYCEWWRLREAHTPVPYSPPNLGGHTQTILNTSSLAVGAQIIFLRSDDLIVPKLPACGCEWWLRLVSPSRGGHWWAPCHDESCARYSRLWCDIRVSSLLPPPLPTGKVSSLDRMMMIAFITFKSSLVPLFEGLWSSNSWEFELSGFSRNRTDDLGIDSPSLWPTEPRLHVRSDLT